VLGFTLEEQDVIFRIISSILHLGNVYFHRKQLKHGKSIYVIFGDRISVKLTLKIFNENLLK
jgi:myosin-15